MKEEIDELWAKRASEGVGPDLPKPKPMEDKHSITGRKNPFSVLCDGEDEDKVPEGGKDPDKPGAGSMDKRRRRKAKRSQGSFKRKGCSLRLKERKWSRRHCSQESTRESSNPQIGARWRMRNPGKTRRASGILRDTKENTHRRDMKAMRRKMQRVETNLAATPGLPGDWKQYGKNVYYNRRTSRVVEVVPFTEDLRREQEDGGATLALESHQVREDQLIPTLTALLTTESDAQVARMWVDTIHKVIQKAEAQKEVEGIVESLIQGALTMVTDSGNEIIDEIESMVKTLIHEAADGTEDGKTKNTEATRACTGEAGQRECQHRIQLKQRSSSRRGKAKTRLLPILVQNETIPDHSTLEDLMYMLGPIAETTELTEEEREPQEGGTGKIFTPVIHHTAWGANQGVYERMAHGAKAQHHRTCGGQEGIRERERMTADITRNWRCRERKDKQMKLLKSTGRARFQGKAEKRELATRVAEDNRRKLWLAGHHLLIREHAEVQITTVQSTDWLPWSPMASSETLVDGADAAVVSKVKEIFIEHQRQTMGTRYMKEMKERRERRMESRNESMHEFIDQLTTDADGNHMTGLQRLDLHQRAVEMNGADRTDPAMLAMLLCREDTGTAKDIAAAAINRAVVGAMDGVWRMITDQPRSGESRKERENRKKRRSKRKRKRNHIVRLEQTAEGDTRMRTIPRRRNGIRPTLAHWIAEQMACPTTSNKSSGHFEQHEESSREHDQTPAPEGGTSEEGESNEDTQVIQSTTGTGEGAQPQTGKHEQDHMCAEQCNSGQTEGKSATRQYLDDLMVSWRTCSEGTSGKAIDLRHCAAESFTIRRMEARNSQRQTRRPSGSRSVVEGHGSEDGYGLSGDTPPTRPFDGARTPDHLWLLGANTGQLAMETHQILEVV